MTDEVDRIARRLVVGDRQLPIYPTRWGLTVGVDDPRQEPLVLLLNAAAGGESPLADAVEHGRAGSDEWIWVEPALDGANRKAVVCSVGAPEPVVVAWSDLRAALRRLRLLQRSWTPPPSPWLFTADPVSPTTTPEEDDALRTLDAEATAVDLLDAEAAVGAEPADLVERRRLLLAAADALALFDRTPFGSEFGDARDNRLRAIHADTALGLRRAALELRDLGVVGEDTSVLNGPVCLDFVRLQLWPPGDQASDWLVPAVSRLDPDAPGDQGVVVERVGSSTARVYWRRDGRRPALLAVTLG